jgi:hypothetical protein
MTVAGARFDNRHLGVVHHLPDEPRAAPRDEKVNMPAQRKQGVDALAVGVGYEIYRIVRSEWSYGTPDDLNQRHIGVEGLPAAAQYNRVAAFQTNRGGVDRHVGS